jgi:hypothetical protein
MNIRKFNTTLVAIYTQNVAVPDEPKIRATLKISERGEPLFEGPIGIETRGQSSQYFYPVPFWWMRLMQDPAFKEAVKTRFTSLRQGALSDASITAKIESYRELLDNSNNAGYNFTRWPILGEWVWPNFFVGQTYSEEVDYLKEWTLNRAAWLDEQISQF